SRRRHTRCYRDWSSDVCSSDLREADPAAVKGTLARMRALRHAAQPQGIKTFGSTFKNPDDPRAEGRSAGLLLAEAGCGGLAVGRSEERRVGKDGRLGEWAYDVR